MCVITSPISYQMGKLHDAVPCYKQIMAVLDRSRTARSNPVTSKLFIDRLTLFMLTALLEEPRHLASCSLVRLVSYTAINSPPYLLLPQLYNHWCPYFTLLSGTCSLFIVYLWDSSQTMYNKCTALGPLDDLQHVFTLPRSITLEPALIS